MSEGKPTGWEGADRWFAAGAGGDGDGKPPVAPDPAPDEQPPTPTCEVCGAGLEPDQTYCLECGSPTPRAPRLRRGGRAALILAGAMIILGLGAGALAFAMVRDDGGGGSGASTGGVTATTAGATVPLPPGTTPTVGTLPTDTTFTTPTAPITTPTATGPTTGFDTVTGPSSVPATTTATPATTTTPPPTTTAGASGASDWPSGTTAWTAVLASVRSEADARAAKSRVAQGGEPAGVLFSSDFPALRPGYWVVFSGTYGTQDAATAQAVKLRPDFPTAYARRIEG